jgi:3-dehydroquinate dehydratase II
MNVVIINGPNLNLLGVREKSIYGQITFEDYFNELQSSYPQINFTYFQSNIEGELIDCLHQHGFKADAILLNAGGYTHTSVAIKDAITSVETPVVEVHISNIYAREEFRHTSLISASCTGSICGFGLDSYRLAVESLLKAS